MARPCPKCKRPNNERAPRCIYCGTTFPEVPAPPAAIKSGPAPAASAEGQPLPKAGPKPLPEAYLVILSPKQKLTGPDLKTFRVRFRLDEYTAKQKLNQAAPWVVRVFPDAAAAQTLTQELTALELDAYVVKQSGIDKVMDRVQVAGLALRDQQGMVFLDPEGERVPLIYSDLFLALRGRIKEKPERNQDLEDDTPAVQLGKMAFPGESAESEKGRVRQTIEKISIRPKPALLRAVLRGHTFEIVDLYRKSSPRAVRLVESEFDFSGLGPEMTPSGLLNFTSILNTIKDRAPDAIFDASYNLVGYASAETPTEDKVKSDLIAELGITQGQKKTYDSRSSFNDFSARLYLHYLRSRKSSQ